MNKRGQEFSIGTLIALVIGIAIVVFIIYAYVTQGNIVNIFVRKPNVDSVRIACENKCAQTERYDYCFEKKAVYYYDEENPNKLKRIYATCYELATKEEYKKFGIEKCPQIDCETES